ncbi:MAG TPA: pentapeptide repeat-containing protein [Crinalium sp.]|jgi:uncharacterized protein YjbI with pentapeptide repeats
MAKTMTHEELLALLKEGVEAWNEWRRRNPDEWLDLSQINLSQEDLNLVNFSLTNLSLANLSLANLSLANLHQANLRWANLSRANLRWVNLSSANLSLANLNQANLNQANLSQANLRWADLSQANLIGVELTGTDLSGANLSKTDLYKAKLSEIDLSGTDLSGANLTEVDLSGADLTGADLRDANLIRANLTGANLTGANLTGANLFRAQALGANFAEADFTGACIEDWLVDGLTNFEGVTFSKLTPASQLNPKPQDTTPDQRPVESDQLSQSPPEPDPATQNGRPASPPATRNTPPTINLEDFIANYTDLIEDADRPSSDDFALDDLVPPDVFAPDLPSSPKLPSSEPTPIYSSSTLGDFIDPDEIDPDELISKPPTQGRPTESTLVIAPEPVTSPDETIALTFYHGIDWKAFLLTFQTLQQQYGAHCLSIYAIEQPDEFAFIVRLKPSPGIDHAELEATATHLYETQVATVEATYRQTLGLTDEQIATYQRQNADLLALITLQANRAIAPPSQPSSPRSPTLNDVPHQVDQAIADALAAYEPPVVKPDLDGWA